MPYEVFTRKIGRIGSPTMTITSLGRISLNKSATRILEQIEAKSVIVMWDREMHKIGIGVADPKDRRAYRLSFGQKGNGAGFSAKTFLDYIEYDYSESRNFPAEWNAESKVFDVEIPIEDIRPGTRQPALLSTDAVDQGSLDSKQL